MSRYVTPLSLCAGLIVVCTVVGIAINTVKEKASVFLSFFAGATDVVIVIIRWFFWYGTVML